MSESRETYLSSVDLIGKDKRAARQAALTRSHDIRKFEIEHYWKRANYFWLLQATVFAAIGLVWKSTDNPTGAVIPVALSALGTITSAAGWFSAQGSKFWQENWEHHIDMLEDEFEGCLHKTVYVGGAGVRWSVSGVNDRLSICFWCFWVFMLLATTHVANPDWSLRPADFRLPPSLTELATIASWVFAVVGISAIFARATNLRGDRVDYAKQDLPALVQTGWPRLRKAKAARSYLVRREPKI